MRILFAAAALLVATPAAAQDWAAQARAADLQAQQDMDRQRLNTLQNDVFAAQTRLQTEQTIRSLELQRGALQIAPGSNPRTEPPTPGPMFGEIPDDRLADSNAKVRAAIR